MAPRYIVRETLQGSFAVRDTKTGEDIRVNGKARYAARLAAVQVVAKLNEAHAR